MHRALIAAVACAFCFSPACGGNSDATKSTSSGGSGNNDASASGGTGGTGGRGVGGSTGGNGGSGGTGAGGSTGGSAGTGAGGSTDGSAGTGVGGSTDGSAGTDAGGSTNGTVTCGWLSGPTHECARGEYCCKNDCTSSELPCEGAAFYCDEAADCPGASCCVIKISRRDGGPQNARCRASCNDDELVMCIPGDAGYSCPAGQQCRITATLPPPYGYCCAPGALCPTT